MVQHMRLKHFTSGLFLFLSFLFIYSCTHTPDEIINPDNGNGNILPPIDTIACDSANVTFPGTVVPILDAYCITCHSGATPQGGLDFTDYSQLAFVAENGALIGSIKHLEGFEPMPQGGNKLSNCEIALIEIWINDTVFVTPPDTTFCDSSFVTYPGTIVPIFEANCIGCHGPPTPAAGIDLTNYEDVATVAQNGSLMGSILYLPGYSEMPKNGPPLTDCETALIQKWINDTTFTGGGGGLPCDPDTVYFQNTVLPLLQSSCATTGCHDEITHEHGIIMTTYEKIMQTVEIKPFEPWDSKLYEVIEDDYQSDRMPPPPGPPFTQDQKDIIYNWILQGALNNYCDDEDCDSVNVSFSGTVFPIIQNNCYGCHSGSNPSGGLSLTNYNQIKNSGSILPGTSGSLLGTITWASGNSPMPKNGNMLSDCNIAQITRWIEDGMPDN